jgi:hypothetical protein
MQNTKTARRVRRHLDLIQLILFGLQGANPTEPYSHRKDAPTESCLPLR